LEIEIAIGGESMTRTEDFRNIMEHAAILMTIAMTLAMTFRWIESFMMV